MVQNREYEIIKYSNFSLILSLWAKLYLKYEISIILKY